MRSYGHPRRNEGIYENRRTSRAFIKYVLVFSFALAIGWGGRFDAALAADISGREPGAANPVLPGYYADPSIVQHEGEFFLYATLDPWGGDTLGCWESPDFKQWTYRVLNWPTKAACTSPQSGNAAVWAPSVVLGPDKKFHIFISVGNEVWTGVADHPLGPWRDANNGKPLVPREYKPGFHMIDAEAFVDDDGTPWLYWGSGHGWINGKCWAVQLNREMSAFIGEPRDVTPTNYFEGPMMVKRHGLYFLMYSQGVTIKDTYQVHYAVGDNPLGPFKEGPGSPILVTDKEKSVISPGHHTVFQFAGKDYILYHRHSIPFNEGFVGRQTCVDELQFFPNGTIAKVVPTHAGPALVQGRDRDRLPATASASSEAGPLMAAGCVTDGNHATLWKPADPLQACWLQLDLGKSLQGFRQEIRFEYAWKPYRFTVQASEDGATWQTLEDYSASPAIGSPVVIQSRASARFMRLAFPASRKEWTAPAVFEWSVTPATPAASGSIRHGEVWNDTAGKPINAHGGGMLFHEGVYYWYGELKEGRTYAPACNVSWGGTRVVAGGVSCYRSTNLIDWENLGVVLNSVAEDPNHDLHCDKVIERPKVVYNKTTKKFVMWLHVDSIDYKAAKSGVAVSDSPSGPFHYLGGFRPNAGVWPVNVTEADKSGTPLARDYKGGQMARDMTLFVDDDDKVYHFYSSEENATMHVSLLTDDYLKPSGKYARIFIGRSMEAPAVFKRDGKYYLIASDCTGWNPNPARSAIADHPLGPWTELGNPCVGKDAELTFTSQSTYVLPVQGKKDAFIFMADRWKQWDLADSRYIWLPLAFDAKGKPVITWQNN